LPKMPEYKSWQQILNTTDAKLNSVDFLPGSDSKAPPRSVLAFAGAL
jgi:isoamylase